MKNLSAYFSEFENSACYREVNMKAIFNLATSVLTRLLRSA